MRGKSHLVLDATLLFTVPKEQISNDAMDLKFSYQGEITSFTPASFFSPHRWQLKLAPLGVNRCLLLAPLNLQQPSVH
jgi:hypothetical protein